MRACCVCQSKIDSPIYRSQGHASMTTMLRLYEAPTVVWFCDRCGHLQTDEIVAPDDYYAHQYSILAASDDEDLLYKVVDGQKVYQVEHRVETLLKKVRLPARANVLDFGCAKGSMLHRLSRARPDITPYFFDVTDRYVDFWRRFLTTEAVNSVEPRWAVGAMPASWREQFDVVCSYYVLEHVADPVAAVRDIGQLLKPGGIIYLLTPNALANPADVIVADHLQHYSAPSLSQTLLRAGFDVVEIDDTSHDAAYIVIGRKCSTTSANVPPARASLDELRQSYVRISHSWADARERIQAFESTTTLGGPACIYGAGFYGNFIASCLLHPEAIVCFVDQNAFLQGRNMLGKPILPPTALSDDIESMYVGLNPSVARQVIADVPAWRNRPMETFYL